MGRAPDRTSEAPAEPARRRGMGATLLRHPAWSFAAVLLIAFNLRPAITSIGPFVGDIRQDLGLSGLEMSLLTTAPVVCLGLFGPLAPLLARRFGTETVLLASLLGIVAGAVIRVFGTIPLYLGTVAIGASMCLLGVLSPVVVKRDFPHRMGPMMGLYTMLISFGAALSTATAVPLQRGLGGSWERALLFWALPAAVAAFVFLPQLLRRERVRNVARVRVGGLMRDPLAWQVTGFLALVSSLAYAVFNWGPSMLQARGLDAAAAAFVVSISYVAQMATGLLVPIIAGRQRDQRRIAAIVVGMTAVGLLGFIFAPVWSLTGVSVVLGLGQGGAFGLALSLIVLRAGDPPTAASLSGLAQSVGYVVGGLVGPFAVGIIHDWAGSWTAVAAFFVAVLLTELLLGLGAGRALTVRVRA